MSKQKILIVDDEKDIVDLLKYNLQKEGYEVITANDGKSALQKSKLKPDLILLDIMMPEHDGFEVCKILKKNHSTSNIPIIFLTAKDSEIDEVVGLELGAEDYIQKPISIRIIIARIKNVFKNKSESNKVEKKFIVSFKELMIDKSSYSVKLRGKVIFFPKKEFEILAFLLDNKGKVYSRTSILNNIWGEEIFVVDRTVDVHIRKIREKLGDYGEYIETIKGVGYIFREEQ